MKISSDTIIYMHRVKATTRVCSKVSVLGKTDQIKPLMELQYY